MTETTARYTFPNRPAVLARLTDADPNPHAMADYYPILADRLAGETLTHLGVVNAFLLSIADYVDKTHLSGMVAIQMTVTAETLMEAVIDDPDVRSAAVSRLREIA